MEQVDLGTARVEADVLAAQGVVQESYALLANQSYERIALQGLQAARHANARAERENYSATHDSLTGFLNRRGLMEHLEGRETPLALLLIDSTNLKAVNDKISHKRGDDAIKGTAQILSETLRGDDVAARVGGDEFVVVLSNETRQDRDDTKTREPQDVLDAALRRVSLATKEFLDKPENRDLVNVGFNAAAGGALWDRGMSLEDVQKAADIQMYLQKSDQHQSVGQYRAS